MKFRQVPTILQRVQKVHVVFQSKGVDNATQFDVFNKFYILR